MLFLPIMSYGSSCIHPMNIGIRQESTVVSAKQKWVDSGILVSPGEKIEKIELLSDSVNFCKSKRNATFTVKAGTNEHKLPFPLYAGDQIMFSVVGSKMCIKQDGTKEYKTIDKQCDEGSQEYFAKVLNKWDCEDEICPNKHIVNKKDDAEVWLRGKEYWGINTKKEDIEKGEEQLKVIHKNEVTNGDKNEYKYNENEYNEISTYILNLMLGRICGSSISKSPCVITESIDIRSVQGLIKNTRKEYIVKSINDLLQGKHDTSIQGLSVRLGSESFGKGSNGILTNHAYEINKKNNTGDPVYNRGDSMSFDLPQNSYGGYNIMVSVINNGDLKRDLYIHIADDDKMPEHSPGLDTDIQVNVENIDTVLKTLHGSSDSTNSTSLKGKIYYGIKNYGCDYEDNEGEFNINLTITRPPKAIISSIYNFFINKVKEKFSLTSQSTTEKSHVRKIYEQLTEGIKPIIVSLLVLFIVAYTLCYFFGLSNISVYEFLMICVRVGIVAQLLSSGSWNFFYNNLFYFFENAPSQLMGIVNDGNEPERGIFTVFDESLDRFLSWRSWQLIISLIFSGPLGIVLFCLIIWGTVLIVKCLFDAFFSFATYGAMIALLITLAPFFIVCILFKYTRKMFTLWISGMATFGLQPVILIIVMQLIMSAMRYVVYSMFNFTACTQCILSISPLNIFSICLVHGYVADYFPDICAIMAFIILAHSLKFMVDFSFTISQSLLSSTAMPIEGPGESLKAGVLDTMGLSDSHGGGQPREHVSRQMRRPISSNQG